MAQSGSTDSKEATKKVTKQKRQSAAATTAEPGVEAAPSEKAKAGKKGKAATKRQATPTAASKTKPAAPKVTRVSAAATDVDQDGASESAATAAPLEESSVSPRTISRGEWRDKVALAAYALAEKRRFVPGGEDNDWVQAEAEVNEEMRRQGIQVVD